MKLYISWEILDATLIVMPLKIYILWTLETDRLGKENFELSGRLKIKNK